MKTCEQCSHLVLIEDTDRGACFRYPPSPVVMNNQLVMARAQVGLSNPQCGEWRPIPEPPTCADLGCKKPQAIGDTWTHEDTCPKKT